jgi:soluble lytic murein transglycosylase-like protein
MSYLTSLFPRRFPDRLALALAGVFLVALAIPSSLRDVARAAASEGETEARRLERAVQLRQVEEELISRIPALSEHRRTRLADVIVRESEAAGMDPLLVLAVIEVESAFDVGAVSHRGAQGLMQLRPPTFQYVAARSSMGEAAIEDPVHNVTAGIRYFRRLTQSFRGDRELALMAYNAGPHRLRDYLRAGEVPGSVRAYPRRVLAEYRRLRRARGLEPVATVGALVPALELGR